jgi:hypothetical protein
MPAKNQNNVAVRGIETHKKTYEVLKTSTHYVISNVVRNLLNHTQRDANRRRFLTAFEMTI